MILIYIRLRYCGIGFRNYGAARRTGVRIRRFIFAAGLIFFTVRNITLSRLNIVPNVIAVVRFVSTVGIFSAFAVFARLRIAGYLLIRNRRSEVFE